MRTLLLGVVVVLAVLPLGCSEDDRDGANDDAGQGSGASAGTGGKGGTGSGGTTGTVDEGAGTGGGADSGDTGELLPLCESICTTQGETSCPPPDHDQCVHGWCLDANLYFPGCVTEYEAMLHCMVHEPAASYYCDDDGMSFPKEEACEGEQAQFNACLVATLE